MNKKIVGAIAGVVIIAAGAFYGGMVYAKSSTPARGTFVGAAGQFAGRTGATGAARTGAAGGLTTGQIISQDASSITVKMSDGSTKIVLIGSNTQVIKTVTGLPSDLAVGTTVVVTGSANSDGSLTAQMVQIRPAGFGGVGSTTRQTQ